MFSKILVGFDGSDHAFMALSRAIEFAKKEGSEIIVYYALKHNYRSVVPVRLPFFTMDEPDPLSISPQEEYKIYQAQKAHGEKILLEAGRRLKEAGIENYELEFVENVGPVDAAVELVETKDIDLVIVGARGIHGPVERLIMGSVSQGIVNKVCSANVLVMRAECKA